MKVAFITRSTLYSAPGGDTVQVEQTAREMAGLGVDTDIVLSNQNIPYEKYALLHFFNLIRPADILYHCKKAQKPFVVSTILCNYTEYDKNHRRGMGLLFGRMSGDGIEYLKTMARWLLGRDHLASLSYAWKGQRNSIIEILQSASLILPNSESEYRRIQQSYFTRADYAVVPNGVNPDLFYSANTKKENDLVICAGRIEGIKNQLNLVKALNNSRFRLLIIGAHAPNQANYYHECRKIAAANVQFIDRITQEKLAEYYKLAKVHVLPSWFETTGLSSIEAAAMGCNIVITDKGDTREYFGDDAFYCDPSDPESILESVEKASAANPHEKLRQKILEQFTWEQAAKQTFKAYQTALAI